MTRFQRDSLQANKKQIPLVRSLIATAKKYGVSAKEFEAACAMANDLLMDALAVRKPLTEICDEIDIPLGLIEEVE